jgi:hypothetical protein
MVLVIGDQTTEDPPYLNISATFPFEPSAASDAVEVSVAVGFEE